MFAGSISYAKTIFNELEVRASNINHYFDKHMQVIVFDLKEQVISTITTVRTGLTLAVQINRFTMKIYSNVSIPVNH